MFKITGTKEEVQKRIDRLTEETPSKYPDINNKRDKRIKNLNEYLYQLCAIELQNEKGA